VTVENALRDGSKFVIDPNTEITTVIAEKMAGIIPIEKEKKEGSLSHKNRGMLYSSFR